MVQALNLKDKIIGKLTVLEKIPSTETMSMRWKCRCECNNIIFCKPTDLNRGVVKSCGCDKEKYCGTKLKPGQKLHKLTTKSYSKGEWLCLCDCGKETTLTTGKLMSGTKSCGCAKVDACLEPTKLAKFSLSNRQYEPRIATARRLWRGYCWTDDEMINFDQFYTISQQNCFYCGVGPNRSYNYFEAQHLRGEKCSDHAIKNGEFLYNGLDRIDSNKKHTIDNVVSCCFICNKAKNNSSVADFFKRISTFEIKKFSEAIETFPTEEISNIVRAKYLKQSINGVYNHYKQDSDLTIEEFYLLSQMPCFYCNTKFSNNRNTPVTDRKASEIAKLNGNFSYNGLDRIDPKKNHNKDNVVPCCWYCNFAKGNRDLEEYQTWMQRISDYQKMKNAQELNPERLT